MDYETLTNCFVAVFEHYKTDERKVFVVHKSKNQFLALYEFLLENQENREWHISFNGLAFDSQITQFIINKNGVECDELEIKGIDVVRTSFPIRFRKFMHEFLVDILKKTDMQVINKKIYEFELTLNDVPIIELAKNTSIKFISMDKGKNYDPANRVPFNFILGTPAQVKAGLAYNDLLEFWKLDKKYPKLLNGQKIKWVYLLENDYGIDALAMKADGTDPKEILDFIEKYIDRKLMYTKELKSKLEDFYNVLQCAYPDQYSMCHLDTVFDVE